MCRKTRNFDEGKLLTNLVNCSQIAKPKPKAISKIVPLTALIQSTICQDSPNLTLSKFPLNPSTYNQNNNYNFM